MNYLQSGKGRALAHTIKITKRLIDRRSMAIATEQQKTFIAMSWINWMKQELRGNHHGQG